MPDSSGLRFFSVEDITQNYRILTLVVLVGEKKAWQHKGHQAREAYTIEKTQQDARKSLGLSICLLQIRTFGGFFAIIPLTESRKAEKAGAEAPLLIGQDAGLKPRSSTGSCSAGRRTITLTYSKRLSFFLAFGRQKPGESRLRLFLDQEIGAALYNRRLKQLYLAGRRSPCLFSAVSDRMIRHACCSTDPI